MVELTRKDREKAEHRRLLLEAAEKVFAQKGFHAATVHEIAELAEFSVGYLYNQFENKTDLFLELVDMRAAEYIADVEERLSREEGIAGKVRTAIAAKLGFFRQHKQFFLIFTHLVTQDRTEGPVAMSERCGRRYHDYMARLAAIFAEGIAEGLFAEADPMALVLCMEGMTNSIIAYWVHGGGKEEEAATPELVQKVFLEGILARGDRE